MQLSGQSTTLWSLPRLTYRLPYHLVPTCVQLLPWDPWPVSHSAILYTYLSTCPSQDHIFVSSLFLSFFFPLTILLVGSTDASSLVSHPNVSLWQQGTHQILYRFHVHDPWGRFEICKRNNSRKISSTCSTCEKLQTIIFKSLWFD